MTSQTEYVRFDILILGLKPNTIHKAYFDALDVGSQCQPIVPSTNYADAYAGAKQANGTKDSKYWHTQVLFSGWNQNTSGVRLSNVITKGNMGDALTSNADGILAFTLFYIPEYGYTDLYTKSSLTGNRPTGFTISKQLNVKNTDDTSRAVVTVKTGNVSTRFGSHRGFHDPGNTCKSVYVNLVQGGGSGTGGTGGTGGSGTGGSGGSGGSNTSSNTIANNSTSNTSSQFEIAQTWFVDPSLVGNAEEVFITKVDLYFKSKPTPISGILKPGVTVYLTPTSNRVPYFTNLNQYPSARLEYDDILTSDDATTATSFSFPLQGKVSTGAEYAFVVKVDGRAPYVFWKCKQGDPLVGTTTLAQGPSGSYIGLFYEFTTDILNWRALHDTDLKFKVYAAKYTGSPYINFVADKYEFVNFQETASDPRFYIGERVYQVNANQTGTVSVSNTSTTVVGTSTLFQSLWQGGSGDPEYILLQSGNTYCLREVISVASNTSLTIDQPPSFTNTASTFSRTPTAKVSSVKNSYLDGGKSRMLVLSDSTANSTVYFANTNVIYGELSGKYAGNVSLAQLKINRIQPQIAIDMSGTGTYVVDGSFYYKWNGSSTTLASPATTRRLASQTLSFTKEEAVVFPSRSYEFSIGSLVSSEDDSKISQINVTATQTSSFVAPRINGDAFIHAFRYVINNDYTDENTKYGNAYSKHISKKINLAPNTSAEDMIVYLTANRPANTDIKVFCKLYNSADSEAFDDKDWTLMELTSGNGMYSGSNTDMIELTYGLPLYPNTVTTSAGVVTTTLNQANVIGSGTAFSTDFAADDVVKVYSSLFPNNYIIGVVDSVTNNTHLALKSVISNNGIVGTGMKIDKIGYPYQAFRNITNDNVARYYSGAKIEYDTFNTFAVKIVLLSDNEFVVPCIKDIRATAVSA